MTDNANNIKPEVYTCQRQMNLLLKKYPFKYTGKPKIPKYKKELLQPKKKKKVVK